MVTPTLQPQLFCNLTENHTFLSDYRPLPLPVLIHYGEKPVQRLRLKDSQYDIDKLIADFGSRLLRSDSWITKKLHHGDALFGTRHGSFLQSEDGYITIYTSTLKNALRLARKLEPYVLDQKDDCGTFHLLKSERNGFCTEAVPFKKSCQLDEETLDLHYGEGVADWSDLFVEKITEKCSGLTIFEGPPGTGKTSYLRHLISQLRETHCFFFVAPCMVHFICDPDMIGFWTKQQRRHKDKQFVMVLEDAEKALMKRAGDNRTQVSAILNMTDGMLADFLKLQVICTINCKSDEIDEALLRPGRLLAHRIFDRMSYNLGRRLAEKMGRELPLQEDYSLAEIFNKPPSAPIKRMRHIGFAA